MTLALAKLEPCGLCSRKFTGSHEGNKMDVIGSFDHSFIIELRRERLHAMLQLFEQTIRANATAEESPRIGFELDSNGK